MGRPKATLPVARAETGSVAPDTFLTCLLRTLRAADLDDDVVVVVGHDRDLIVKSVGDYGFTPRFVFNPHYESGQLSSILAAVEAIDRPTVDAMLLTLVDVPCVSSDTVRRVVSRYRETRAPIVRPVSGSRHGHPVIIDRVLFDELRGAEASVGAKPIVRAHVSAEGDVEVNDEGAFVDIDTPDDYQWLFSRSDARR